MADSRWSVSVGRWDDAKWRPSQAPVKRPGTKLMGQGPTAVAAFHRMCRARRRGNQRLVKKAINVMSLTLETGMGDG